MQARVAAGEPAANVSVVFTLPSRYYMTLWQVGFRGGLRIGEGRRAA